MSINTWMKCCVMFGNAFGGLTVQVSILMNYKMATAITLTRPGHSNSSNIGEGVFKPMLSTPKTAATIT